MKRGKLIFLGVAAAAAVIVAGCSTTRSLEDGQYLLRKNTVKVNDPSFKDPTLASYISQKPNSYILGVNPLLSVYNWSPFFRKLGVAPVIYDPAAVSKSITGIQNHLRYIGYYGSEVESEVQVKGRKVFVNYYVTLGKRYKISAIDYQIPEYGTFRQDYRKDLPNSTLAVGQYLSEEALEAEAERSARYLRDQGYYGFTKSFYAFEADTLSGKSDARLQVSVRDYALGDTPDAAREHRKYSIGNVTISHPNRLKIRPSVLENLNQLRPGQLYSEKRINETYTRFASVNMLSGVNIEMTPRGQDLVDCNISLRNSGLQGFKTNLEASVNSTGLIGLSPQLTYFHRNIFHGGELLNLAVKGNFQFRPSDNTRSTEFSVSTTLRFPKFIGLPNRIFDGPYIPRTDVGLSFNYQDRPDFRRTVISTSFAYNGRFTPYFFYTFTPLRANIARVFVTDSEYFFVNFGDNPYMLQLFSDNFDMGVSSMLYYTTDPSAIPMRPYHYARLSIDLSGNVLSLFNRLMPMNEFNERTIWETPYSQYVRGELQLGKTFRFGNQDKHSLALRLLAGAGYGYGNSTYLPMEKLFYSGGSSSMRGWQARTLGPGTDTSLQDFFVIPTQLGAIKLEANAEYRFPLFWKFEGAAFLDCGNIWDYALSSGQAEPEDPEPIGWYGGYFNIKYLPESLGLNWGLGLRINLEFLLLRVDAGIRLHDPARPEGNRWVAPKEWFSGGNTAIHFGIGYPF